MTAGRLAAAFVLSAALGAGAAQAQQPPAGKDTGFTLKDDDAEFFANGAYMYPLQVFVCTPDRHQVFVQVLLEASADDIALRIPAVIPPLKDKYTEAWQKIRDSITGKDDFGAAPSAALQAAMQKNLKDFTDGLEKESGIHFRIIDGAYLPPKPGCGTAPQP